MRILVLTTQVPFIRGGAEVLADTLVAALRASNHEVDLVALPYKWYPATRILDQMLASRLFDLSEVCGIGVDRVIALKFPAYLVPHHNKVAWLLHQHRSAYELWGTPFGDLQNHPVGELVRSAIHAADAVGFQEMQQVFSISQTVTDRLQRYSQISATTLYPPPEDTEHFYCADAGDYLFYPSRIELTKRQGLVLDALALCRQPVKLVFCGTPSVEAYGDELRARATTLGIANRVTWLGRVSQQDKLRLYAECTGVVFTPFEEDLGYITMEAMLSSKPVVTCRDSGGPLEFVQPEFTGLVADATPEALAAAFDRLWEDKARAAAWGRAGREAYLALDINWNKVVAALTA